MLSRANTKSDATLTAPSRLGTLRLGKVFTYLLNAQTDRRIAETLLIHVKNGRVPTGMTEVELRARDFMNSFQKDARYRGLVALTAYVVERVNGLADYLFPRLLIRFSSRRQQAQVEAFLEKHALCQSALSAYSSESVTWSSIIAIGTRILSGNRQDIDWYAGKHGLALNPSLAEFFRVILLVQKQNMAANTRTATALDTNAESASRKVWAIRLAARQTPYPQAFLRAAARTQRAASNWDQLFAWLIALKARGTADAHQD